MDDSLEVLAIDDDPVMLQVLAHQLGSLGVDRVTPCTSARHALGLLQADAGRYAIVFLDLQMPEMDGVELIRVLPDTGYHGNLVLISGEDRRTLETARRLAAAYDLRVSGALTKPITREEVQGVLAAASAGGRPAPQAPRRPHQVEELARAISHGELENHYQPQVNAATGKPVAVEALVRWRHPTDGLLFPDHFIGMAEAHGLIDDLTQAVLMEALEDAGRWRRAGLELGVAVNVSMENLVSLDFPDRVDAAVRQAGFPCRLLTLEVTESRLMRDPRAVLDILTRLRLKRVDLSIDDFGTGYSSLSQLRDLPFDEVKVDRSFAHRAWHNDRNRAIVQASLRMASQLEMRTVAEGVEDRQDWDFLQRSGCGRLQGYFIARPMPAAALPGWYEEWTDGTVQTA